MGASDGKPTTVHRSFRFTPQETCSTHQSFRLTPNEANSTCETKPKLSGALKSAILQQFLIMVLASAILDGGVIFGVIIVATLAYWGSVAAILLSRVIRSDFPLSTADIGLIQVGFSRFYSSHS